MEKEIKLTSGTANFIGYSEEKTLMFCNLPQVQIYNEDADKDVYIDLEKEDIDKLIEGLQFLKETFPK